MDKITLFLGGAKSKVVGIVGVSTFVCAAILIIFLVLGQGTHLCSFPGQDGHESFRQSKLRSRQTLAYKFIAAKTSFEEAKKLCQDASKGLAKVWEVVDGFNEFDDMIALVNQSVWLGGKFVNKRLNWDSGQKNDLDFYLAATKGLQAQNGNDRNIKCLIGVKDDLGNNNAPKTAVRSVGCEEKFAVLCVRRCRSGNKAKKG